VCGGCICWCRDFDTASAAASESAGGGGGGGGGGGAAKAPEAVVAGLEQKFKPYVQTRTLQPGHVACLRTPGRSHGSTTHARAHTHTHTHTPACRYVKVCRLLVKRCMPSTVQGKSGDGLKSKAGGGSKSDGTSAGGRSEGEAGGPEGKGGGPEGKGGGPEGKGGGPEGAAGGSESEAFGAGGDTAVMFKVVAEIFLAAGHYKESVKASEVALSIFPKIVGLDCSVRRFHGYLRVEVDFGSSRVLTTLRSRGLRVCRTWSTRRSSAATSRSPCWRNRRTGREHPLPRVCFVNLHL
jgi:hypothetical protein